MGLGMSVQPCLIFFLSDIFITTRGTTMPASGWSLLVLFHKWVTALGTGVEPLRQLDGFSKEFDRLTAGLSDARVTKGFAADNIAPKLLESRPPLHDQESLWTYRNSYMTRLRRLINRQYLENADVILTSSLSVSPGDSIHLQLSIENAATVWASAWSSTKRVCV
jgi:hypothetical protein